MHHNSTWGNTTNQSEIQQSQHHFDMELNDIEKITAFMLVLLFVVGTVGNTLTIWVFMWKKRRTRKRFEVLLSCLAMTDLFASIIVPSLFLYGTITKYQRWDFGVFGCKFISSLFPVSVTISEGLLILISYERYKSLSNPFGNPMKNSFILCWLFITLAIACLLVSPYIYTLEFVNAPSYGINTCAPAPIKFEQIFLYSCGNICRDFAATFSMIILGVMTNRALKSGGLLGGIHVYKKRQENANKARKMLIVVVCVFSFCVIPLDFFQISVYTIFKLNVPISKEVYEIIMKGNTFLLVLQIANSSTNFIIYSRMNRSFTRHLFACAKRSKLLVSSSYRRATFRSTRTESVESFATTNNGAILAILPITSDNRDDSIFELQETKFSFAENNNILGPTP